MILSQDIYKKATQTVKKCGTRNPVKIAQELGVHLYYESFNSLLGLYTCKWRRRMIFINSALEEPISTIVLAHELGHDFLHREMATNGLREYNIFGIKDRTEQEANAFAAHLLLDDDEVLGLVEEGLSLNEIASILNTSTDLLLIKLEQMNALGHSISIPYPSDSGFIKQLH